MLKVFFPFVTVFTISTIDFTYTDVKTKLYITLETKLTKSILLKGKKTQYLKP